MKRVGTIVIAPPWPRTGSANLFEAQCRFFAKAGRDVALLVAPCDYHHNPYNFELVQSVKTGFAFDSLAHRSWASLGEDVRLAKFKGRVRWLLAGRDSYLNIQARMARDTFFEAKFLDFISTHEIPEIYANHVFNILLAKRVAQLVEKRQGHRPKLYLESHDIQSLNYGSSCQTNVFSERPDLAEKLNKDELDLMRRADSVTHCSESDLRFFRNELPELEHNLLPPTISEKNERLLVEGRDTIKPKTIDFLWLGNNNGANAKSLLWFIDLVLPLVDLTSIQIYFVGTVREYFRYNETVLYEKYRHLFCGEVNDIIPYYEAAKVLIVPVTSGTGVSIKFIEALCSGKPTVASTGAFRGLSSHVIAQLPLKGYDVPTEFFGAMMAAMRSGGDCLAACTNVYDDELSLTRYLTTLAKITNL